MATSFRGVFDSSRVYRGTSYASRNPNVRILLEWDRLVWLNI